jgi:adenosine deaminase/adenosine deaminase CECR1
MPKTLLGLMIASALALTGSVVHAHAASASSNEQTTNRYFATLVSGTQPKLAELTLFFSMMPKGGDLHHHYSGALYAEQYLDWVDQQHYCINKVTYRIETDKTVIDAERAKAPGRRDCLSSAEVIADNAMYRELLQRWSDKDFYNHGALQPPPDRQFFDTFAYFNPVSASNNNEGLMLLKKRAIQENLSYIETMFELVPFIQNANFDTKVMQAGVDNATLIAEMTTLTAALEQDQEFNQKIGNYIAGIKASSAGRFQGSQPKRSGGWRQHRRRGKPARVDARLLDAHANVQVLESEISESQTCAARGRAGAGDGPAGRVDLPYRGGD